MFYTGAEPDAKFIHYLRCDAMTKVRDKIRFAVLLNLLFFAAAFKHPLYLSVTDLKYTAKEKSLQGSVKLFTSDIEGALKKIYGSTIDLIHPKDTLRARQMLDAYLKKHVSIRINGKPWPYVLHGFEP